MKKILNSVKFYFILNHTYLKDLDFHANEFEFILQLVENWKIFEMRKRVRKIPWRRKWQPTSVFLSGKSHGQGSLVGYSPWGHKRVGHD